MSRLDDLKENLSAQLQATWGRIQESDAYNQLKDKFDNLTPNQQRLSVVGTAAVISLIILSIPFRSLNETSDTIVEFEGKRMTIRELLKVARDSSTIPNIPMAPALDQLQNEVNGYISKANLLPEQIKSVTSAPNNSNLVPSNLTAGLLEVSLAKLNINQILDLGYQIQSQNQSVKLKDMIMTANAEDARYYDVVYKIVTLAVPALPEPEVAPPRRGRR